MIQNCSDTQYLFENIFDYNNVTYALHAKRLHFTWHFGWCSATRAQFHLVADSLSLSPGVSVFPFHFINDIQMRLHFKRCYFFSFFIFSYATFLISPNNSHAPRSVVAFHFACDSSLTLTSDSFRRLMLLWRNISSGVLLEMLVWLN